MRSWGRIGLVGFFVALGCFACGKSETPGTAASAGTSSESPGSAGDGPSNGGVSAGAAGSSSHIGIAGLGGSVGEGGGAGTLAIGGETTNGGVSGVGGGASMAGSGDVGGVPSGGQGGGRALTLVLKNGPWVLDQQTTGFAVDAQGRLFLNDENNVYVVTGMTVDVFLTRNEIFTLVGKSAVFGFKDLDVGPDDLVYIGIGDRILRSSTAHQTTVWYDFGTVDLLHSGQKFGVVATDMVALATDGGLFKVTPTASTLLYPAQPLNLGSGCATEDLTAAHSGVFLYQPGCYGSPLVRGNIDGSGMAALYGMQNGASSPFAHSTFVCSARDPMGGFYLVEIDQQSFIPSLYHLTETSDQSTGIEAVPTQPSFAMAQAQADQTDPYAFSYCSLAGAPDGSLYLLTYTQIWRVAPP